MDTEASDLKKQLDYMRVSQKLAREDHDHTFEETTRATIEVSCELDLIYGNIYLSFLWLF